MAKQVQRNTVTIFVITTLANLIVILAHNLRLFSQLNLIPKNWIGNL